MKKITAIFLIGLLSLGTGVLFAQEPAKKENVFKQIASVQGRGLLNLASMPAETVYVFKAEKTNHPKAWPMTYAPRLLGKMITRAASSVNDLVALPLYVKWSESTPLTRRFDLPDYAWQKE